MLRWFIETLDIGIIQKFLTPIDLWMVNLNIHMLIYHSQLDLVIVLVSFHPSLIELTIFNPLNPNFLGQRFAIMEEKCIIARILREFKVESKVRTDQLRLAAELIIRPMFGNHIRFERRSYGDYTSISPMAA